MNHLRLNSGIDLTASISHGIGIEFSHFVFGAMRRFTQKFYYQVSQGISIFVGCVLLTIGLSGIFGVFLQPIAEISFLIEPMGLGPDHDRIYWNALTIVGFWLVLFFYARLAALTAIILIGFKWLVLKGFVGF